MVTFAVPIGFGAANALQGQAQAQEANAAASTAGYQVTSLKPSRPGNGMVEVGFFFTPEGISATGVTLQSLIQEAYGVGDQQISGAPDWVKSDRYDIEARLDKSVADELGKRRKNEVTSLLNACFRQSWRTASS